MELKLLYECFSFKDPDLGHCILYVVLYKKCRIYNYLLIMWKHHYIMDYFTFDVITFFLV